MFGAGDYDGDRFRGHLGSAVVVHDVRFGACQLNWTDADVTSMVEPFGFLDCVLSLFPKPSR